MEEENMYLKESGKSHSKELEKEKNQRKKKLKKNFRNIFSFYILNIDCCCFKLNFKLN
jgi:hypothetical protein